MAARCSIGRIKVYVYLAKCHGPKVAARVSCRSWRRFGVCDSCVHYYLHHSPFIFNSPFFVRVTSVCFGCAGPYETACETAWEPLIRYISNGLRRSRRRRLRLPAAFGCGNSDPVLFFDKDRENPWCPGVQVSRPSRTRRVQRETDTADQTLGEKVARHATTGTQRVRIQTWKERQAYVERTSALSEREKRAGVFASSRVERWSLSLFFFFRRHICAAVTCNLLFSVRPRVVAEIAAGYVPATCAWNVKRGSSLNLKHRPWVRPSTWGSTIRMNGWAFFLANYRRECRGVGACTYRGRKGKEYRV